MNYMSDTISKADDVLKQMRRNLELEEKLEATSRLRALLLMEEYVTKLSARGPADPFQLPASPAMMAGSAAADTAAVVTDRIFGEGGAGAGAPMISTQSTGNPSGRVRVPPRKRFRQTRRREPASWEGRGTQIVRDTSDRPAAGVGARAIVEEVAALRAAETSARRRARNDDLASRSSGSGAAAPSVMGVRPPPPMGEFEGQTFTPMDESMNEQVMQQLGEDLAFDDSGAGAAAAPAPPQIDDLPGLLKGTGTGQIEDFEDLIGGL